MEIERSNTSEIQKRSPEEQAIIDGAVDAIIQLSFSDKAKMPRFAGLDWRQSTMLDGVRQAALAVVTEIDGTPYGFGRLATIYADHAAESYDRVFRDYESLRFAAEVAENFPVEPEVAEGLVTQCVEEGEASHAEAIAHKALGRCLTGEEVMDLAKRYVSRPGKSSDDEEYYLKIALNNDVNLSVLREISDLFRNRDLVRANNPD